jgi:nicotinamidase-related amidase
MSASLSATFALDPSETALVLIEYQNEFTTPGGKLHDAVKEVMSRTRMLDNSVKLTDALHRAGCTIIHCPISFEPVRV